MDMQDINRLESELEKVKVAYEQYFMGRERMEPQQERQRIRRMIADAASTHHTNTAVRFKAQQLRQKLVTYENYWNRINKQIEDGTYRRHRFKVQLNEEQTRARSTGHVDLNEGGGDPSGYDSVIQQYQGMQQKAGQKPVNSAKLNNMLKQQEATLRQKFKAKRVEFRVVMEDGKPKLKAKPIR